MNGEFHSRSYEWTPRDGVYVRVSTQDQGEKGTSLDTQIEECIEMSRQAGGAVAPEHLWVDMVSGATMNRPAVQKMLAAVANREIDRLFYHVQDRLSREPLDTVMIARECIASGVQLFENGVPVDLSEIGQLIMYVRGFGYKQELRSILERSQRAKWSIAGDNQWPDGNGCGLYGYDYDHALKVRVINQVQAAVVQQVFQWAIEGINCHRIATMLNDANIPTPRGKLWPDNGVQRMLTNPAYTGVQRFGTRKSVRLPNGKSKQEFRPVEETVEVTSFTPAIIDEDIYEAVQLILAKPQAREGKKGPTRLLTGFGTCLSCGRALVGSGGGGRSLYYRCNATNNFTHRPKTCDERNIRQDWIEPVVWELVSNAVRDPQILIAEIRKNFEGTGGNLDEEVKKVKKQVEDLEGQQVRLLQQRQLDQIDQNLLERMIAPLKKLYDEKRRSLGLLMEQLKRREVSADMERTVRGYCERIGQVLDNADFDQKRAVFAAFSVKVEATVQDLQVTMSVDPAVTVNEQSRRGWWHRRWRRRRTSG